MKESQGLMPSKRPTVALFLAVLNEVTALKEILPRIRPDWYDELIIVDGGSTDGTTEYLQTAGYAFIRQSDPGLAESYREGFLNSSSDYFITFQPDGNSIPELIPELLKHLSGGYDIVFVSRYLPPACSQDDTWVTAFGNWLFTFLINLLFNVKFTDCLGGFRAYKRDAVMRMGLHEQLNEHWVRKKYSLMSTWEVGGCIRAAKLKLNTLEIPGDEPPRIAGESKLRIFRNGIMVILNILYELVTGSRYLQTVLPTPQADPSAGTTAPGSRS
jgi:glycosyltransferase involved in cell wall biosynthesis